MNDTWPGPASTRPSKSQIAKRKKAPPMRTPRPSPLPMILDLDEIEKKVNDYERDELVRTLFSHEKDDNVEHLLEEVLVVLKMLHGEEVGKKVFSYRESLLKRREEALEKKRLRLKDGNKVDVDSANSWTYKPVTYIWSKLKKRQLKPGGTGPF